MFGEFTKNHSCDLNSAVDELIRNSFRKVSKVDRKRFKSTVFTGLFIIVISWVTKYSLILIGRDISALIYNLLTLSTTGIEVGG